MTRFHSSGAPTTELMRSFAAQRIADAAHASGLLLAHFEHRYAIPMPEHWLPQERPDLGEPATWRRGMLPEVKFQSFGLDRRVGSFHPSHQPKWTAHELCHALVGFAWKPGASQLWTATAARLAELLPVALWYFLDEAGLHRCPDHMETGPLFGAVCIHCDILATQPAAPQVNDDAWIERGRAFLDAELAAISKTIRSGCIVPNRHATLELASDGLAYAAANQLRLNSSQFAQFTERFCSPQTGMHPTLEVLEERVCTLFEAITMAESPSWDALKLSGTRQTWIAQDLAWRILCIQSETSEIVAGALQELVDRLTTVDDQNATQVFTEVIETYTALNEEWVLPEPEHLFATGYDLPKGHGRSVLQCAEGLAITLPATWTALGEDALSTVAAWLTEDVFERVGIGRRFANWLANNGEAWIGEQALFEAAVAHASQPNLETLTLGAEAADAAQWKLASGVELLSTHHEVELDPETVAERGIERLDAPMHLAIRRAADGEVHIAELTVEAYVAVSTGSEALSTLAPNALEALAQLGIIQPTRWHL